MTGIAVHDETATLRAMATRLAAENTRLQAEVASLRLTLGGKTFSADVPDVIDCPIPGACAQVAEIERLRGLLRKINARAKALPGDDLKELQRQMLHIQSLSAEQPSATESSGR